MKKCTSFEDQNGRRHIWGKVYFGIIVSSCLSSTKQCLRFLLTCFAREIKGLYQSSLKNEADFREIMNVLPNILAKNYNFKTLRRGFVDERTLIRTTSISSCHLNIPANFGLRKKTTENAFLYTNSELLQNRTEK